MAAALRNSIYPEKKTPGPGAYVLPIPKGGPKYRIGLNTVNQTFVLSNAPGPGQYTPNQQAIERPISQRITFGGRVKTPDGSRDNPGPGSYNPPAFTNYLNTAIKIGNSSRNDTLARYRTDSPGPAAYEVSKVRQYGPKCAFPKAEKCKSLLIDVPGPGAYSTKQIVGNEGTKSTLVGKRPDTSPKFGQNSPGPGAYQPTSTKRSNTGFSMGKEKRCNESFEGNRVPGPLTYTPNDKVMRSTSPFWGMGKGKRPSLLAICKGPGPCTYSVPSKFGEGPKCALHGKRVENKKDNVPGPGSYEPNSKAVLEKYPAIALSTGPRVEKDFSTRKDVPGPGHYPVLSTLNGPKFGFGASGKSGPKLDKSIPGPGTYKIPCLFARVASYSIPGKEDKYKYV